MPERVALITGASRGIGRGIAVEVARVGYDVLANYRTNREAAEQTKACVEKEGRRAAIFQADVADLQAAERLVRYTVETFGRIDLLVNNAGIAPKVRADILEANPESFDEVLSTNLRGPYFLTQAVSNRMIEMIRGGHPNRPQNRDHLVDFCLHRIHLSRGVLRIKSRRGHVDQVVFRPSGGIWNHGERNTTWAHTNRHDRSGPRQIRHLDLGRSHSYPPMGNA